VEIVELGRGQSVRLNEALTVVEAVISSEPAGERTARGAARAPGPDGEQIGARALVVGARRRGAGGLCWPTR